MICDECGFDGSRWSDDDLERTLAHTDDLIGFVVAGSPDAVVLAARPLGGGDDGDIISSAHNVMHRLYELAEIRRTSDAFEPMVGTIGSMQASTGGVPKHPVTEATIGPSGIEGDGQNNRRNHGRPWQALCLYSADLLGSLTAEGHPIVAGGAGENLTIRDIDWSRMRGGLTIEIGDVILRTSSPAAPCHKIGDCFVERDWNRIDHNERPGWARWYASVLAGGTIRPGQALTITA